jgi:hypothetical protein
MSTSNRISTKAPFLPAIPTSSHDFAYHALSLPPPTVDQTTKPLPSSPPQELPTDPSSPPHELPAPPIPSQQSYPTYHPYRPYTPYTPSPTPPLPVKSPQRQLGQRGVVERQLVALQSLRGHFPSSFYAPQALPHATVDGGEPGHRDRGSKKAKTGRYAWHRTGLWLRVTNACIVLIGLVLMLTSGMDQMIAILIVVSTFKSILLCFSR